MSFEKQDLDLVLVPSGLLVMLVYHLSLLFRCINRPHTTVIGFENNDKKAWVARIMQVDYKEVGIALTVINSNTSAATFLCSVSLTLSSLIGAWVGSSSTSVFQSDLIYGDTRPLTISIKYIGLLSCFLLSFFFFVQSARHFVHANYLISTPRTDVPVEYVEVAVIRGSNFWSLGLRALYFALNLLLWFFGPIPMFVSSLVMVTILHYLDSNSRPLHTHQYPSSRNHNSHTDQGLKTVGELISEVGLTAQFRGRRLPDQKFGPTSTNRTPANSLTRQKPEN